MVPMLELNDFKFKDRFVDISEPQFAQSLQLVNAQFSGVYRLWSSLPPAEARAKRELCINYLLGWQLVNMYPEQALDVSGTGGMPISSKKAGPVFIKYKDTVRQAGAGVLDLLTTNEYGLQALMMIQTAPENYMLY